MSTKILSRDHCKVFHLQPRAFVSVRLRDVVTVTISGTGRTLDSGPWLTLICHPLVSYHQLYSPFQNINLPFNILVTHMLQFGRPHVWQNSINMLSYSTLQLTRTMHIGAFLSIKIYRQKCLFVQLNFDGIYHFANALKGKAKLWSKVGAWDFKSSMRAKTSEFLNSFFKESFVCTARYENHVPSSLTC